jgi:hypothetical protein
MERRPAKIPDQQLGFLRADEIRNLAIPGFGGNGQKSFFTLQVDLDIASVQVVFLRHVFSPE